MSYVSATDYFAKLAYGEEGFAEIARSRSRDQVVYRGAEHLEGPGGRRIEYGDVVRSDHPAVRQYPADFATAIPEGCQWPMAPATDSSPSRPVTAPRSAARVAPRADTPPSFPWTVTLSLEPSRRYEVKLLDSVAGRIMSEARMCQGLEVGGYLWSRELPGRHSASVSWVNGPGGDSKHARTRMSLTTEESVRSELMPPWLDPERALHIVGDWHGHVVAGSYLPSDQDLNSWASNLWKGRASEFVSLILSHGRPSGPTFVGWVTRTVAKGRYVCEPVHHIDDPYGYGST